MVAPRSTLTALLVAALLSVLGLVALLQRKEYSADEHIAVADMLDHHSTRAAASPPISASAFNTHLNILSGTAVATKYNSNSDGGGRGGKGGRGREGDSPREGSKASAAGELTKRQRPRLILGVASAPWATDHRNAIRETVGQCLRNGVHLGPNAIKLVFFTDATSHVATMVEEERNNHHDIIITPTRALGQLSQKDLRLLEYLRQARALDDGKGADFYGKMDDDVFVCPHNIAKLVSELTPNSYLGTASARGKKTHDQQFIIFGEEVVNAVLELHDANVENRTTPQEESRYLHKLISVHADKKMAIDYRTYPPTGSAITHVRDNKEGKPCMRSFEECPFKFKSGAEFCSGIKTTDTANNNNVRNSNISFHRFRDKFRGPPGKALRKYFDGVCDAGEASWVE